MGKDILYKKGEVSQIVEAYGTTTRKTPPTISVLLFPTLPSMPQLRCDSNPNEKCRLPAAQIINGKNAAF